MFPHYQKEEQSVSAWKTYENWGQEVGGEKTVRSQASWVEKEKTSLRSPRIADQGKRECKEKAEKDIGREFKDQGWASKAEKTGK